MPPTEHTPEQRARELRERIYVIPSVRHDLMELAIIEHDRETAALALEAVADEVRDRWTQAYPDRHIATRIERKLRERASEARQGEQF